MNGSTHGRSAKLKVTPSLFRYLRQHDVLYNSLLRGVSAGLEMAEHEAFEAAVRYEIETACIRAVDNFLSYIAEVLQLCITKRPEMLRSAETLTVEEVVRFSRHSDLVSFLIDRTITRLAYKSFSDIEKFVSEKTNVSLVATEMERTLLMTAIELRNIYSHNRGEASEQTIRRLEQFDHPLALRKGEQVDLDLTLVEELLSNLKNIALAADQRFESKFRLRRVGA